MPDSVERHFEHFVCEFGEKRRKIYVFVAESSEQADHRRVDRGDDERPRSDERKVEPAKQREHKRHGDRERRHIVYPLDLVHIVFFDRAYFFYRKIVRLLRQIAAQHKRYGKSGDERADYHIDYLQIQFFRRFGAQKKPPHIEREAVYERGDERQRIGDRDAFYEKREQQKQQLLRRKQLLQKDRLLALMELRITGLFALIRLLNLH